MDIVELILEGSKRELEPLKRVGFIISFKPNNQEQTVSIDLRLPTHSCNLFLVISLEEYGSLGSVLDSKKLLIQYFHQFRHHIMLDEFDE